MRRAQDKIGQLLTASEIGCEIPSTTITNRWENIRQTLPEDIILKMAGGILSSSKGISALYTTRVSNTDEGIPRDTNSFPGYWQPYISKHREWRITVVGERTFDVAIHSDGEAKIDWRNPKYQEKVIFRQEEFPDDLRNKCIQFLKHFKLKFGAFDFIEDNDSEITFLECNTNGQFGWLEEALDLPISQSIATEIIKIAKANQAS